MGSVERDMGNGYDHFGDGRVSSLILSLCYTNIPHQRDDVNISRQSLDLKSGQTNGEVSTINSNSDSNLPNALPTD